MSSTFLWYCMFIRLYKVVLTSLSVDEVDMNNELKRATLKLLFCLSNPPIPQSRVDRVQNMAKM